MMSYREIGRNHLKLAEGMLERRADEYLKYAALELRLAMEAFTYEIALFYKDDIPPEEYGTWQARKLLKVLLEIDPYADQGSKLFIGEEKEYGVAAPEMNYLGEERVLGMALLKRHYDAMGSFLHSPTFKQREKALPVNSAKIRGRCEEVVDYLTQVLASPIFNINFNTVSSIKCVECEAVIRKNFPPTKDSITASCFECRATYIITKEEDDSHTWKANIVSVKCANSGCEEVTSLWRKDIQVGTGWECSVCGGKNILKLACFRSERN